MIVGIVSDFALDAVTGDLEIVAGNARLATGDEAILLDWNARLRTWQGEWFRDQRIGLPYRSYVNGMPLAVVRAQLLQVTQGTAGVAAVSDIRFAFDRKTRRLSVQIDATLTDDRAVSLTFAEAIVG